MANRHYHFKFNVDKDATYIQRLDAQVNMQQYIRRLILSDIAADSLKDIIRFSDGDDRFLDSDKHIIPDIDEDMTEFNRRKYLMDRYCHGSGADNDDPDYCYSCPWSYQPKDALGTDVIHCEFEGLNADEMEDLIRSRTKRLMNQAFGKAVSDGEQIQKS